MKKVTGVTTFNTDVGTMLALTYTEIDSDGNIIKRNARMQKVVVDEEANAHITAIKEFAQKIVDAQE